LALNLNRSSENCFDPENTPTSIWKQQGELLRLQGKIQEADALFEKFKNTPPRSARDCYLAAHLLTMRGKFHEALPLLQEAVQKDPQNFSAWFVCGNCHDSLQNYREAIACYTACIALRPQDHWAWFNRGLTHFHLGNFHWAIEDFDQTLRLWPKLADAYLNRGRAKEALGLNEEAIRDLNEALDHGAPPTQIYFDRAAVREKMKDRQGAQRDREELLKQQPHDEVSWIARGLAHLPQDPKGALADLDHALEINRYSFPALQNKAHVLADHIKDDRQAVQVLDEIVKLYPDSAMARAGRGVSLARINERTKALADAEEALLLDTNAPNVYQVACIYALTSRQNREDRLRAFELLSYSLKRGFGLQFVDIDTDLDPIRQTPEFAHIVAEARKAR
jgi:tetratricopeptide (TPR) repeat protein